MQQYISPLWVHSMGQELFSVVGVYQGTNQSLLPGIRQKRISALGKGKASNRDQQKSIWARWSSICSMGWSGSLSEQVTDGRGHCGASCGASAARAPRPGYWGGWLVAGRWELRGWEWMKLESRSSSGGWDREAAWLISSECWDALRMWSKNFWGREKSWWVLQSPEDLGLHKSMKPWQVLDRETPW